VLFLIMQGQVSALSAVSGGKWRVLKCSIEYVQQAKMMMGM
jgi:hypothetical protein